jgi:2-polyprenyl-6-methoxyphenol hydroxylase-like FAD-dependent oxidoreductase
VASGSGLQAPATDSRAAGEGRARRGAIAGMLDRYTASRLPRTTDIVRWSRRAATMTTGGSLPAVAFRNTVIRLTGKLAPGAALRGLAPIYDWQPPAV